MTTYIVQALGWGDDEDQWENIAAFSTQAAADQEVNKLKQQWIDDNGDLVGCELRVEQLG
jgi:hypothetical protein